MGEQTLTFIESVIQEGWLIFIGVLVVGQIIKSSLPVIDNKYIPLIGGLVGVIFGISIPHIFPDASMVVCGIKGLVVGWAATGAFETLKNLKSK